MSVRGVLAAARAWVPAALAGAVHAAGCSAQPVTPISQDRRITASCTCGCVTNSRSAVDFGVYNDMVSTSGSSGGSGNAQATQNTVIRASGIGGSIGGFAFASACRATGTSVCEVRFSIPVALRYTVAATPAGGGDFWPVSFSMDRGGAGIFSGVVVPGVPFSANGVLIAGEYRFNGSASASSIKFPSTSAANFNLRVFPDECEQALPISGPGPFSFDNTDAITVGVPSEPLCNFVGGTAVARDVWYRWTSSCPGRIRVSTCTLTSVDTKIAVYGPDCPDSATDVLACNDNACGLQSAITTRGVPNREYLVRIGVSPAAVGGVGQFRVDCCPCDYNADGTINSSDFFEFLSAFLLVSLDADFNGDGMIDTADFFEFLGCFFTPPAACAG